MSPSSGVRRERIVVQGLPLAPGLAVGSAVFHDEGDVDIPVLRITADDVKAEQRRLANAIRAARRQLAEVEASIEREVGSRDARIFSVQGLLLDDPSFRKSIRERIQHRLVNAEVAVRDAVADWTLRFSGFDAGRGDRDPVADLKDVGRQLLRILAGRPRTAGKVMDEASRNGEHVVLVTRELLPSDAVHLDRSRLAAIVTQEGGVASHAAILARGLGIPAVTNVDVSTLPAYGGDWIVDGGLGRIILNPTPDDLSSARERGESYRNLRADLLAHAKGFAKTADDVAVELMLNLENFDEIPDSMLQDLRGIGLFRTEFLFMDRDIFPSEEEQYRSYAAALERVAPREVTFRTIDVGGDKPLSYLSVPSEPNPVLGWRGLRLSLEWPDVFYAQLRALLRASAHGPTRIMLPMVTMVEEFRRARAILEEIQADLAERGVPFDKDVKLGAMIEVPAAALAARDMAAEADFLSVGTNDLSQYALAVDRNNSRVASLFQPLHPGVIQLVRCVIDAGHATDTPVSLCGEMAGDPEATLLLLGLGLRCFSMTPYHLPVVRRVIGAATLDEAQAVAREVLGLHTTTEIREAVRRHTLRFVPELATLLGPAASP